MANISKTINTDIDIDIDVDLDEFSNDELICEFEERLTCGFKRFDMMDIVKIKEIISKHRAEIEGTSLVDIQINELFDDARKRFTQRELESRLK